MTWSAQIHGVENLAPEMEEAFSVGTERGLEALGVKGAEMVQTNIATPYGALPPAVAFGMLVSNIVAKFSREATLSTEIIGVNPSVQAFQYAAPVETGTLPHMPPPSALVPWVQKKFSGIDEKSALSLAFAIATKIRQRGTQGHFMFDRALETLEPMVVPALEAAIAEAFREYGFTGGAA